MNNKIRAIGALVLVLIWVGLTGFAWFGEAEMTSDWERRELKQWPGISMDMILDGEFQEKFEDYTLDQFPLRDRFRQIKSMFQYYVMQRGDNNDIYIVDGYASQMDFPLNEKRIEGNISRFNKIYETYLKDAGCKSYVAIVPDKGYYLAEGNGYLSMDYEKLFSMIQTGMPWATNVDLTDVLTIEDYYYTDTHWRQECLIPAAQKLAAAMGVTLPQTEDFTAQKLDRKFFGVYYGQAALPMDSEDMYILRSDLLDACKVYQVLTTPQNEVYDKPIEMYDLSKVYGENASSDMYDLFCSGETDGSIIRIDNPNAATDRELIVFRDSFTRSMIPLLVQDYATVTLVDIRWINSSMLDRYLTFDGQDVLFMYSTLVLNSTVVK